MHKNFKCQFSINIIYVKMGNKRTQMNNFVDIYVSHALFKYYLDVQCKRRYSIEYSMCM